MSDLTCQLTVENRLAAIRERYKTLDYKGIHHFMF